MYKELYQFQSIDLEEKSATKNGIQLFIKVIEHKLAKAMSDANLMIRGNL